MRTAMPVDAVMFLSSQCPHCPGVLAGLSELVKRGHIGRLEVVNVESHPEAAEAQGVRTVPWVKLGPFVLTGTRSPGELESWAQRAGSDAGMADAFHDLLKTGDLQQVLGLIADDPGRLAALLPIVGNPEASMNVRLGAGAAMEDYADSPSLAQLVPALGALSEQADARIRADACHYLGLSRSPGAKPWLVARLSDESEEVREIAQESLEALTPSSTSPTPSSPA